MNDISSRVMTALVCVSAMCAVAPAHATTIDWKTVDAAVCLPYGPGTTVSELTYNQLGVTNPGTTNESVLCPMPTDGDGIWSATPGTSASVTFYYRAGATPGHVACTAFVSKASVVAGPTYSLTSNPPNAAAGARAAYYIALADLTGGQWGGIAPATILLCTLNPKVTLGSFAFWEGVSTNIP